VHTDSVMPLTVFDVANLLNEDQARSIEDLLMTERQNEFKWKQPPLLRMFVHVQSVCLSVDFELPSRAPGWMECGNATDGTAESLRQHRTRR
jgi:hypothetical protein